jgi:hypothetical protein
MISSQADEVAFNYSRTLLSAVTSVEDFPEAIQSVRQFSDTLQHVNAPSRSRPIWPPFG